MSRLWDFFRELDSILEQICLGDKHMQPNPVQPPIVPPPVAPVAPPPSPKLPTLTDFCLSIKSYEGWGGPGSVINGIRYPDGTSSYRNNNPGNCRYSSVGYLPIYGLVQKTPSNFAHFKDYATGWLYLTNLVKEKIRKHPEKTIRTFMEVYAPTSDGNNPELYAQVIARDLKVTPEYPMRNFL